MRDASETSGEFFLRSGLTARDESSGIDHIARILQVQSTEAQRLVVPEAICPVTHNISKLILKKRRDVAQPVTSATPTALDQIGNWTSWMQKDPSVPRR